MGLADVVADTRKRRLAGVERVIVWPGGSVWLGRHVGQVREHAIAATCGLSWTDASLEAGFAAFESVEN